MSLRERLQVDHGVVAVDLLTSSRLQGGFGLHVTCNLVLRLQSTRRRSSSIAFETLKIWTLILEAIQAAAKTTKGFGNMLSHLCSDMLGKT